MEHVVTVFPEILKTVQATTKILSLDFSRGNTANNNVYCKP